MRKPLFRLVLINQKRLSAKIKKKSILRKNGTRKTLFRPQKTMPLKIKRSGKIKAIGTDIIVKKKAILLEITQNLEKTSINLGNLYAGD